jgi:hypothetical protein
MTYMRFKGDREVWLLDSRLSSAIRRRATEYRDKQILDFKSDEIQGVYVEAPEQTLYLEHNAEEDKWQYSESKTGQTEKPDSNKIKTYLKSIPRLRTISFIDDPDSASKVNFENPDFNAEIALKGGNIIKLRGVFASDNNRRYVVKLDEQKTPLYVYSASMLNRLARDREYMTKPAPPPPPPGQRMRGMPPGGGKPGAQGGQQQLSPEMRKKLMEAMRKQQMQGN